MGSVDTSYSCYDADYNACDGTLNTNLRICCHCDSNNYNNIMRAAISGDTTAMTIALADPIQDVRPSPTSRDATFVGLDRGATTTRSHRLSHSPVPHSLVARAIVV